MARLDVSPPINIILDDSRYDRFESAYKTLGNPGTGDQGNRKVA
jgi:hypothetical protein